MLKFPLYDFIEINLVLNEYFKQISLILTIKFILNTYLHEKLSVLIIKYLLINIKVGINLFILYF